MRLSALRSDRGWRPDYRRYNVLFNGEKRRQVITADEEAGEITCYVLSDHGYPLRTADGSGFQTCVERGEVRIVERDA